MKELVFELGTEEIPARLLGRAQEQLLAEVSKALDAAMLETRDLVVWSTPRRLAITGLVASQQPDRSEELIGPPIQIAYTDDGQPSKATLGFARRAGVDPSALERRQTPKGEKLALTVHHTGKAAEALLPDILTKAVHALQWPKAMRWGAKTEAFIRPVHWIVALYGGHQLPMECFGVKSGNETRGHRFLAPKTFAVQDKASWLGGLRQAYVEPDPKARAETIRAGAERLAKEVNGQPVLDAALLQEITGLAEWPVPLRASFEESYLSLPDQVLITTMKVHQRYIAIEDSSEKLSAHFIVVAGTESTAPEVVARGNSRVIAARFSDARFSFDSDRQRSLDDFINSLGDRAFLKGLGSMRDKALRLDRLARALADELSCDAEIAGRAGRLAKFDLSTQMVGEFPELQGEMGRDYARLAGEDERICLAIEEHYRPRFAGDSLPTSLIGKAVALADRLDAIVGCFALGLEPTGSADPYALRRQALGIVRIVEELPSGPTLGTLIELAHQAYGAQLDGNKEMRPWSEVCDRIKGFFRGRMKATFTKEVSADLAEAVLSAGYENAADARGRLQALDTLRKSAGWEDLAITVKRVANIVSGQDRETLDPTTLTEAPEQALYEAFLAVKDGATRALDAGNYDSALAKMVCLKPNIDAFFDDVMVMSPVPAERQRRLALLGTICNSLFDRIASFDKVST